MPSETLTGVRTLCAVEGCAVECGGACMLRASAACLLTCLVAHAYHTWLSHARASVSQEDLSLFANADAKAAHKTSMHEACILNRNTCLRAVTFREETGSNRRGGARPTKIMRLK
eukprot:3012782-Pleurochrysis_carterae.AAC.1